MLDRIGINNANKHVGIEIDDRALKIRQGISHSLGLLAFPFETIEFSVT